ncbi:hypothetical protein DXG01_015398 [Tephrocybe rancida]|nr:hypothetical protein DXG01_015398 [Tephrocybe rancida]
MNMPPTVTRHTAPSRGSTSTALPNDTIILVIGEAGAGKSSFINSAIDRNVASVSDGYIQGSHTKTFAPFVIDDHSNPRSPGRIILVDTPGFNDSPLGDIVNVQRISAFLATQPRKASAGIIYIYDITNDRFSSGDSVMNPSKFSHVSASRNVLLTTVKWSELLSQAKGERRQELIRTEWAHIFDDGARIVPFDDSPDSARDIVNQVCLYTTSVESLQRDMANIFSVAGGSSRPSSRPGSRPGSMNMKEPGCFASLFRSSRNAY